MKESKSIVGDGDQVHKFLRSHLLQWLEALSLLGRISESVRMIDDLLTLSICFALAPIPKILISPFSPQMPLIYPDFFAI